MSRLLTLLATATSALAIAGPVLSQPVNCGASGAAPGALAGPVRVGVTPPPPLPAEIQPPAPAYGYAWTPGYWGWNAAINDYYWAPGAWIAPPAVGLLWTPPWWGWDGAAFVFHIGYWGPTVGFYGGIPYGYGYFGHGYDGGYWRGRTFYYNRIYNNLGTLRVNAVYAARSAADRGEWRRARASYNGGRGGFVAVPTAAEVAAARQTHIFATAAQARHIAAAAREPTLRAGVNGGRPHAAVERLRPATVNPSAPASAGHSRPEPSGRPPLRPAETARPATHPTHQPHDTRAPGPPRDVIMRHEPRPPERRAPAMREASHAAPPVHPAPARESRPPESRPAAPRPPPPRPPPPRHDTAGERPPR